VVEKPDGGLSTAARGDSRLAASTTLRLGSSLLALEIFGHTS
jgi:hypothetical protein